MANVLTMRNYALACFAVKARDATWTIAMIYRNSAMISFVMQNSGASIIAVSIKMIYVM